MDALPFALRVVLDVIGIAVLVIAVLHIHTNED